MTRDELKHMHDLLVDACGLILTTHLPDPEPEDLLRLLRCTLARAELYCDTEAGAGRAISEAIEEEKLARARGEWGRTEKQAKPYGEA